MVQQEPLVTIVIPCYNLADYLGECLNSLLGQTCSDWEAVVVDDASTKGDPEVIVQLIGDARIRYVRRECNQGPGSSRNTGTKLANAGLVVVVDADDMLAPIFLERVLTEFQLDPQLDAVFADLELFGAETGIWQASGELGETLLYHETIPGAGTIFRYSLWEKIGGFCEAPELRFGNEDWDFWLSAAEIGLRVNRIPVPLYKYRRQTHSLSKDLRYYDSLTREFIYCKHQKLYDAYHARSRFLGEGYFNSATAARDLHEYKKALKLAWQGFRTYRNAFLLAKFFAGYLPGEIKVPLRKLRRLL